MKNRTILIGGVILLVALLLILILSSRHPRASQTFGFGVTMTHKRGHLGGAFSDDLSIAFITNQTSFTMTLSSPVVQRRKPDGGIINDEGIQWNGEGHYEVSVPPDGEARLPFEIPKGAQAFRITYDYNGGALHGRYESSWMPNTALEPTPTAP